MDREADSPACPEGSVQRAFGRSKVRLSAVSVFVSSPTFGTGLILGGAYYYPQTDEEKASQPASFTGAAAAGKNPRMMSDTRSR